MNLPRELGRTRYPLGLFELVCKNWCGDRIQKLYSMQTRLSPFTFDMLGMSIYPDPEFDLPIFIFDVTRLKRKMVAYINFMPLFQDKLYIEKYVTSLEAVFVD